MKRLKTKEMHKAIRKIVDQWEVFTPVQWDYILIDRSAAIGVDYQRMTNLLVRALSRSGKLTIA